MNTVKLSPSLMCADFIDMRSALDVFQREGVDYLHIDIMDGHYVPNFTLGIDFCKAVARYTSIPLDIHLMIENVDEYIPSFASIGNALLSIHPETCYHPLRSLRLIKSSGARAGIAIDPSMPLETYKHMLPEVDFVCIMTVNPGYAGQELIPQTIEKIRELSAHIDERGYDIEIEVDGNVSWKNIPVMVDAGADVLVAGTSSLFDKSGVLSDNLSRMRGMLGQNKLSRVASVC
ncbi:MAG: ribulose-phosphate 3-epimerase [Spirochaetes bacterium]|nr:ribulose-phosphate 3-epimerase [Spirochaetota bacterium]